MRKRSNRKWSRVSASYSLEAAFVVPIILGLLFALLYFLCYEHDKTLLHANIKQEVIILAKEQKDLPDQVKWREQLQQKLWIANVDGGGVSKTSMKIKGSGKAQMDLGIPVMEYFLNRKQEISCSYSCSRWQPEQMLRQKDVMPTTGED